MWRKKKEGRRKMREEIRKEEKRREKRGEKRREEKSLHLARYEMRSLPHSLINWPRAPRPGPHAPFADLPSLYSRWDPHQSTGFFPTLDNRRCRTDNGDWLVQISTATDVIETVDRSTTRKKVSFSLSLLPSISLSLSFLLSPLSRFLCVLRRSVCRRANYVSYLSFHYLRLLFSSRYDRPSFSRHAVNSVSLVAHFADFSLSLCSSFSPPFFCFFLFYFFNFFSLPPSDSLFPFSPTTSLIIYRITSFYSPNIKGLL